MSLAYDLHRAHKDRLARMDLAARKAAAARAQKAPPPPRRVVALPPGLIRLLTAPEVEKLPRVPSSVYRILNAVSDATGIAVADITGNDKNQHIVKARQVAMWICLVAIKDALLSWTGPFFNRHHSTLIYAANKVEAERERHRKVIAAVSIAIGLPLADMTKPDFSEQYKNQQKAGGPYARKNEPRQSGGDSKSLGHEGGTEGRVAGYGKINPRRKPRAPVRLAPPPKARSTGGGEAVEG